VRTVGVKLEAEVAPYIAGMEGASKATDRLADKLEEAATAGDFSETATSALAASGAVDELGDSASQAARKVDKLDDEIANAKRELYGMAAAFAAAETAAERLDIGKAMARTRAGIRQATASRDLLKDLVPDVEPGRLAALGSKIGTTLGESVGLRAGLVAAPLLLSALGGAVSAAAGAVGIGAGLGLVIASDPGIQEAGKALGKTLFDNATARARTAFLGPTKEIIGDLGHYGETVIDQWGDAFDKLAPAARPFVGTVLDAVTDLSGVIADIAADSGPLLKTLGDGFDDVADSVGGALRRITGDAERNAAALGTLFHVISGTIDLFGLLAEGAIKLADPLIKVAQSAEQTGAAIGHILIATGLVEKPLHQMRAVHIEAADAMEQATGAAYDEVAALKSLADFQRALANPTFALIKAQDDLAAAQKAVTKAQKDHGKSSPEYRAALHDAAMAALDLQAAASEVAKTSTGRLDPALKATLQAAGVTAGTIKALEGEFVGAKKSGDAFAKNYQAKVTVLGLPAAIATAKRISETLRAIKDENVNVNYTSGTGDNSSRLRANYRKGMAFGGPVMGEGPKGTDSEWRLLAPGEHVWTAPEVDAAGGQAAVSRLRSAALSGVAGSPVAGTAQVMPAGGGTQRVIVEVRTTADFRGAGDAMGQALIGILRTKPGVRATVASTLGVPS
jgi:hypothetical protein